MITKLPIILFIAAAVSASDETVRKTRSLQPGAPDVNNKDQPWQLDPHIERDNKGNTNTDVNIKHHGENHDFDAGWSKVVRGPNKAKPTWHVGGTYRWRRSLQPGAPDGNNKDQPWQLDPHIERDDKGNTNADVNIKHHGENHDFDAGWSKVVRGPNKAKPTWHVGGIYRWRRSLQPGAPVLSRVDENGDEEADQSWQFDPYIERDEDGNTKADISILHRDETFRFRRSTDENSDEDDEDEDDTPWKFNPQLGRGDDGNARADINLKRHGENHDIEASWSKVVEGPNRAKPTWHVGGTFKW